MRNQDPFFFEIPRSEVWIQQYFAKQAMHGYLTLLEDA
jgi:hypothetical protein